MWTVVLLVAVAACSGPEKREASAAGATDNNARTLVQKRCGGCHKPSRELPVFVGAGALTPDLAMRAADRVCAGEMPQDGSLPMPERDEVATALCSLAPSPTCRPCSAP